jgi:hypothetical protein
MTRNDFITASDAANAAHTAFQLSPSSATLAAYHVAADTARTAACSVMHRPQPTLAQLLAR